MICSNLVHQIDPLAVEPFEPFVKFFSSIFLLEPRWTCDSAISSTEKQLEIYLLLTKSLKLTLYISYLPTFLIFPIQTCRLLGAFFPFFPYLTNTFWFILYTEHLFIFLKYSTVHFATLSSELSESSARFLDFERTFLNLLKLFFVGFETFLTFGELRFSGEPQRTKSLLFSQSKLRKETTSLVLHVFRYLSISCNLGDYLPS